MLILSVTHTDDLETPVKLTRVDEMRDLLGREWLFDIDFTHRDLVDPLKDTRGCHRSANRACGT